MNRRNFMKLALSASLFPPLPDELLRVYLPSVRLDGARSPEGPTACGPEKHLAGIGNETDLEAVGALGFYSWAPTPQTHDGYESVPMVRDWDDLVSLHDDFYKTLGMPSDLLGGNSDVVLFVNEYDLGSGQAEMSIRETAIAFRMFEALFPDRKLGAPVTSQDHFFQLQYVRDEYHRLYGEWPRWDVLTVHAYFNRNDWYDGVAVCQQSILWHVEKSRLWGASEVWVTEFGPLVGRDATGEWDWDAAIVNASDMWNWMVDYPEVARVFFYTLRLPPGGTAWYCPFPHLRTELFYWGTNDLTPLGEWYRGIDG